MEKFKIVELSREEKDSLEQLGTKAKFWFFDKKTKKLFKQGRPDTGEDWAEVVVSKICEELDIPHAKYEFAKYQNMEGTITESFVPQEGRLVLGNELLATILKNIEYDTLKKYGLREYKLSTVLAILKSDVINVPIGYKNKFITSAFDVFVGYIMLDCLISNPDRHHENWGLIVSEGSVYLSPTYDHASGLGCREPLERKRKRLISKDEGFKVKSFVKRAKTPFYDRNDGKKLTTLESVILCSIHNKKATMYWLKKLENLDIEKVRKIFHKIPNGLIREISIEFAIEMLKVNRDRLLAGLEVLSNEK
ncbi:hypothetical protein LXN10_06390 [Arcobacter sp. KX21116]|uniref:hypothetical protein n=1 Tax=Arcobacter iocasae TaxID=2906515 RepID=UPI0035D46649